MRCSRPKAASNPPAEAGQERGWPNTRTARRYQMMSREIGTRDRSSDFG